MTHLFVAVDAGDHVPFTEALKGNSHVTEVTVDLFVPNHRDLGATGERDFALWKKFCKALGALESLRSLTVFRSYAEEDHVEAFDERLEEAFAKRLAYLLRKTTQVQELKIDGCIWNYFEDREDEVTQWNIPRMALVAKEIMAHPSLEDFTFEDFTFDTTDTLDTFAAAVCTVPNLRKFKISTCSDPVGLFNAISVRRLMEVSTLRDVTLRGFELQESHAVALCLESSKVEKLSLENCRLLGNGLMDARQCTPKLKKLAIMRNTPLNRDHCISLANGLRHTTTLESLSLCSCFREDSPIEGMLVLSSWLLGLTRV